MAEKTVFPCIFALITAFCLLVQGCVSEINKPWPDTLDYDQKKAALDNFMETSARIFFADLNGKMVYLTNPRINNEGIEFSQSLPSGKGNPDKIFLKFAGLGDPGLGSAGDGRIYVELQGSNKINFYFWSGGRGKYGDLNDAISTADMFADSLYALIHNPQLRGYSAKKEAFKKIALAYRLDPKKYKMTGEARNYFVQAYFKGDDPAGAVRLYNMGLAEAPWYPLGHYDLAILLGQQTGDYKGAVEEMKDYLELLPEAGDTHEARKMIREWEKKAAE